MRGHDVPEFEFLFVNLGTQPNFEADPLLGYAPLEELNLFRHRELYANHQQLYNSNEGIIDCLYSRHERAVEQVTSIVEVSIKNRQVALQAAADVRSCRLVETAEELAKRTVAPHHGDGPILVGQYDPMMYAGWEIRCDAHELAACYMRADIGFTTPIDYEISLLLTEIGKYHNAIEAQQRLIRRLVAALAQSIALAKLQCLLERHDVDGSAAEMLCGKVAALKCLWSMPVTTEQSSSCWVDSDMSSIPQDQTGSGNCRQARWALTVAKTGRDTPAQSTTSSAMVPRVTNRVNQTLFGPLGQTIAVTVLNTGAQPVLPSLRQGFGTPAAHQQQSPISYVMARQMMVAPLRQPQAAFEVERLFTFRVSRLVDGEAQDRAVGNQQLNDLSGNNGGSSSSSRTKRRLFRGIRKAVAAAGFVAVGIAAVRKGLFR